MAKATWNDQILAESDDTVVVEGNHYFPESSINKSFFKESKHTSICPWKGMANYYDIEVNGKVNKDAAWVYHMPKPAAKEIAKRVAFWKGVSVEA